MKRDGVFTRCVDHPQDRKIPVYIAGGYETRLFVKSFAELLQEKCNVQITYPWWDKSENSEEQRQAQAKSELQALRYSEILIVLDKGAKTGTSFEFGYFMGANRGTCCVWMYEENEQTLDWFASVLPLIQNCPRLIQVPTVHWSAKDLVLSLQ